MSEMFPFALERISSFTKSNYADYYAFVEHYLFTKKTTYEKIFYY